MFSLYKHYLFYGKNYQHHQIGIQEIVQLNSNKHGFKSSRSLLFCKKVFLKFCRIHMKTPDTCTSNEKKVHCRCFLMNFAKFFKNPFLLNTSTEWLLDFFHSLSCFFVTWLTNRNQVFSIFEMFYHGFQTQWISWTLHSLYFVKQMTQLLLQRNSCCCRHFSETPGINLHWISVLHCPVILHIKVTEAAANVIHWFRVVL